MLQPRSGENASATDVYEWGADETVRTFRTYAVIAGILIPLFWLIYRWTNPGVVDPLWMRTVLTFIAFAVVGLSLVSAAVKRYFVVLVQGYLYVVTVWFVGLSAANAFSPNFAVGLLFVIAAVAVAIGTGLRRTGPLTYYLVFAVVATTATILATPVREPGQIGELIFIGCVFSIALVVHVAASATIRAQARLSVSERKYRTLFAAANDAILLIDPETNHIVEANQKALELYGHDRDQMAKLSAAELGEEDWLDEVPCTNRDVVHRRRDGSAVHLLVSTTRIEYGHRPVILSINRDVTERRRNLESLSLVNEALRQRNLDLQDFANAASHDLQEPVRKMHTFADLLQQEYAPSLDETGRDYLGRMQGIATQMSCIVADLLAFSRIASEKRPPRETDLHHLAREVVDEFGAEIDPAETRIRIGDLPTVRADPLQMRTLLRNLISNALDSRRDDEPLEISLDGWSDGERCRVTVGDNGVGIDEKYHDQIFSPFRQLKSPRPRGRTGMGLPICKRIAEHHGGTIGVKSRPGEGSSFTVEFPCA